MYTFSNRAVYPDAGSPSVEDIALGLSRMVRFAGQTQKWYCVLAHSFTVAELVEEKYRLHALLHDAPEAIVSDVVTSWKSSTASFNENVLLDRIYYELGVPSIKKDFKAQAAVKRADRIALCIEADILGHPATQHPDFQMHMSKEEREIAYAWTKLQASTGPLPWINGEFNKNYIDMVKEGVDLCLAVN